MRNLIRSNEYQSIGDNRLHQELYIDNQDDLKVQLYGYENVKLRSFLYHFFGLLFLGIPYVIFKTYPKFKTVKYRQCPLRIASIILVKNGYGKYSYIKVETDRLKVPNLGPTTLRFFIYQHTKYVWSPENQTFSSLDDVVPGNTIDDYLNNTAGLFDVDYMDLIKLYGPNKIEVEIKSYWRLFIEEVLNPFYFFQVFSIILWCVDDYVVYAACVVVLTMFSSITSLIQTRKQSQALHDLVQSSLCHEVKVVRQNLLCDSQVLNLDPAELVPGDLIILPPNMFIMPCDAVLLTGECIMNESVLTGESIPVTKTALHSSNEIYSTSLHNRHTLFSGTTLTQTRYYEGKDVIARVVRTGFYTTKGALVKSILFPSPVGLKFYKDSLKFVFVLFTIAAGGMAYCIYLYWRRHAKLGEIITRALDIITVVVPPALPAAMAMGTVYSQNRLKERKIFCISPPRINVCGKIKLACFDKTGTLTLDSLNMNSVIACERSNFLDPASDSCYLDPKCKLIQAMASCHSLTRIDGKIVGDPLDINMFEFTKWEFEEPDGDEHSRYDKLAPSVVMPPKFLKESDDDMFQVGIIRQFPFSSTLQCMSVIARNLEDPNMTAFTKGAPEKIMGLCKPETLPYNYNNLLSNYTVKGYRVIAVAYKDLHVKFSFTESQKVKRDVIESNLNFLGFLIMQNPLKDETVPVIRTLHNAKIRTVMITGDNILTAIAVARDCDMVETRDRIYTLNAVNQDGPNAMPILVLENSGGANIGDDNRVNLEDNHYYFAIEGKTWEVLRQYYSDIIPSILAKAVIFARFQPDQKTQVITSFQGLDYVVAMVGDGANDCGALKAAHVGVSLSQAEASVAAPFTSAIENISCLVHLMLEGRCALVTSFAIFKYMALYSLIQFITLLILYRHSSILGDYQFLFIDLIITTVLAITIGRQGPSKVLTEKRPLGSLVSVKNVIPVVLQIATCAGIQLAALYYLFKQSWFEPIPDHRDKEVILSWENTVLFTVSCFQYIIVATVFSKGKPYREPICRNFWFIISAILLAVFTGWIMIFPCKKVAKIMEIIYDHDNKNGVFTFRCLLLTFPLLHFILALFIENGIGETNWFKKVVRCVTRKRTPKNRYKLLVNNTDFEGWINVNDLYQIRQQHAYINVPII